MTLKQDHLKPGDCVSCDHYISPIPGRAIAVSGHSSSAHGYNCGTIYVDHATGFVFVRHQTSTSAQETIRSKMLLEREARDVGVSIKKYHSDNGVFSSKEFRSHCDELNQKLSFSGVGAKFQNGVAERGIQTVSNMAKANMFHAMLHWPGQKFINMWPLAMQYAVWVHNRLPPDGYGASPEELWSGIKCHESHLPRAHVFGCPVYVLDPRLQDGKQIPKWDSKVRQGVFVGFSPDHSTNVPPVYNPKTQHISPQYHVIFDDHFTTVPAFTDEVERNEIFAQLFTSSRERFVDVEDLGISNEIEPTERLARQDLASSEGAVAPEGATVPEGAPSHQIISDGAGLNPVGAELDLSGAVPTSGAVPNSDGAVLDSDGVVLDSDGAELDPDGAKQTPVQPDPTVGPRRSSRLQAAKLKSGLLCGFLTHT
eukprot:scaffold11297_cov41-Cyclotella_meneghiniana.AAC.1